MMGRRIGGKCDNLLDTSPDEKLLARRSLVRVDWSLRDIFMSLVILGFDVQKRNAML